MRNLSQQINQTKAKSESLKQLMEDVLTRAKQQGATDAAVAVNHDQGFGVDVRMGTVETVAFSEEKGVCRHYTKVFLSSHIFRPFA